MVYLLRLRVGQYSHKDTNPELTGFHEALSRKRKVGVILDVLSP